MNKASVLLVGLAMITAGCGGSKSSSAGATSSATADQGVKHAQCMRENGLPGYPDPGQGTTKNLPDRDSPEFKKAQQACQSLEPPENRPGTPENAALQAKMLKYAQCIRKNGVPNFPDPQGGRILVKLGTIDGKSPQFKKAVQACRSLEVAGANKGTGG